MKCKRLKHFTDVFCEMFTGWRLSSDDINTLFLYIGELKMDLLNKKIYFNYNEINISLYIFDEIRAWFIRNMEKENIDINNILEAYIKINNNIFEEPVNKKSRTKRKVNLDINIIGYIKTDEKEYITDKNKMEKYHYVQIR
ncbi:MAG: hypothetical protein LBK13_10110 [Spirochaetales bacterium]|nr:hypothetical protein [Spirochaetales bacterium]